MKYFSLFNKRLALSATIDRYTFGYGHPDWCLNFYRPHPIVKTDGLLAGCATRVQAATWFDYPACKVVAIERVSALWREFFAYHTSKAFPDAPVAPHAVSLRAWRRTEYCRSGCPNLPTRINDESQNI